MAATLFLLLSLAAPVLTPQLCVRDGWRGYDGKQPRIPVQVGTMVMSNEVIPAYDGTLFAGHRSYYLVGLKILPSPTRVFVTVRPLTPVYGIGGPAVDLPYADFTPRYEILMLPPHIWK